MPGRPKVLFISSWYPNSVHPTQGNFVQQHILAAQKIATVALLHVVLSRDHSKPTHVHSKEPFDSHLIYLPKIEVPIIGVLFNYFRVLLTYWKYASKLPIGKPDIIHANVLYPVGIVGVLLKWRWRIPLLFTEHWTIYHPYAQPRPSKMVSILLKWLGQRADLILPVSLDLGVAMSKFGMRVPMKVVPNVVNPEVFTFRSKSPHRAFRFVHVSSLDPIQKNFHLLIRAFYELKKTNELIELHVVSDGDPTIYTDIIQDFDFSKSIHFHGKQEQEGVAAILNFADALVLSSRYENLPCVLIESLACGTPVIATNVGGVAEIVHNKNGILVQSESLPELTEALRAIQSMQFDSEGLRLEAIEKYGPTNIAQLFLEAYQMVLTKDVA